MEPTLSAGDWILVDPRAFHPLRRGDLVVVPDPREPDLLMVKRVDHATAEDHLLVVGDAPEASTDSRTFGPVAARDVIGTPWFRYWPLRRMGRLR